MDEDKEPKPIPPMDEKHKRWRDLIEKNPWLDKKSKGMEKNGATPTDEKDLANTKKTLK